MEIRTYIIEEREAIFTQVSSEGKIVTEDVTIDLDDNGRPTNCYVVVENAPPAEESETADLLEAAAIMGLEPEEV